MKRNLTLMLVPLLALGLSRESKAAQSQSLVHGEPSACWSLLTVAEPLPWTDGDFQFDGPKDYVQWYIYNSGRDGVGTVDASDTNDDSYITRRKRQLSYLEAWQYCGDRTGHLEGLVTLTAYGEVSLTREGRAQGVAAAQATGFALYESNTEGQTVVQIDDAGMETTVSTIGTMSFFVQGAGFSMNSNVVTGFGQASESDQRYVFESKCTNYWEFTTYCGIGVEAFVDSSDAEAVMANGMISVSVTGTVTLSELDPEDCP